MRCGLSYFWRLLSAKHRVHQPRSKSCVGHNWNVLHCQGLDRSPLGRNTIVELRRHQQSFRWSLRAASATHKQHDPKCSKRGAPSEAHGGPNPPVTRSISRMHACKAALHLGVVFLFVWPGNAIVSIQCSLQYISCTERYWHTPQFTSYSTLFCV